jgi:hypothetical protein
MSSNYNASVYQPLINPYLMVDFMVLVKQPSCNCYTTIIQPLSHYSLTVNQLSITDYYDQKLTVKQRLNNSRG